MGKATVPGKLPAGTADGDPESPRAEQATTEEPSIAAPMSACLRTTIATNAMTAREHTPSVA
jgi:hypothetical protein